MCVYFFLYSSEIKVCFNDLKDEILFKIETCRMVGVRVRVRESSDVCAAGFSKVFFLLG